MYKIPIVFLLILFVYTAKAQKKYHNEKLKFSIQIPANYLIQENNEISVSFYAPAESIFDNWAEHFNISTISCVHYLDTLYYNTVKIGLYNIQGFDKIEEKDTLINNYETKYLLFNSTNHIKKSQILTTLLYIIKVNETTYNITGTMHSTNYKKYLTEFKKTICTV